MGKFSVITKKMGGLFNSNPLSTSKPTIHINNSDENLVTPAIKKSPRNSSEKKQIPSDKQKAIIFCDELSLEYPTSNKCSSCKEVVICCSVCEETFCSPHFAEHFEKMHLD